MNSPTTKKIVGPGAFVSVPSASGRASVTLTEHVSIFAYGERVVFQVSKESAIDWAKSILTAYDVPFCNRVPGAGTGESS